MTAQQGAAAAALAALAPLRGGRIHERFGPQLDQVFAELENGRVDSARAAELDAELVARTAAAAALLQAQVIAVHSRVAEGELGAAMHGQNGHSMGHADM